MKTETIIFDLGGVLIDWNPRHLYRKIFQDEQQMEYFLQHITTSDWNEEQDAGRSLAEATEILVAQHPQYRTEIQAFYGRWTEMLGGPIAGTVALLEAIKQQGNHGLYALTNWSAETWPIAWERYAFLQWFEGILVSGQEKIRKPDPAIYEMILDRFQIKKNTTLFIDDNLRNITAAKEVGIPSVHFQSPEQLATVFRQRGLIA